MALPHGGLLFYPGAAEINVPEPMEGLKKTLNARLAQKPNRRLHSETHALADEISAYFNEQARFGMYLGVIKRIGAPRARAVFAEVKDSDAREPRKLFFWKCREVGRLEGLPRTKPARKHRPNRKRAQQLPLYKNE